MTLCYAVVACLLTAFLVVAAAIIFGGPDPMREQELADLADKYVDLKHRHVTALNTIKAGDKEAERMLWVIAEQGKMIDLKNDQIETLSNVINDRHGKGNGFKGLGGH